jgi:hypothetical protein
MKSLGGFIRPVLRPITDTKVRRAVARRYPSFVIDILALESSFAVFLNHQPPSSVPGYTLFDLLGASLILAVIG